MGAFGVLGTVRVGPPGQGWWASGGRIESLPDTAPTTTAARQVRFDAQARAAKFKAQSLRAATLGEHRPEPKLVLLIDDLGPPLGEAQSLNIEQLYETLELASFEIVGLERNPLVPPITETTLLGEVRLLIGQSSNWDEELRQRLDSWMRQTDPPISAVLHLARGSEAGALDSQLIALDSLDRDDLASLLGSSAGFSAPPLGAEQTDSEPWSIEPAPKADVVHDFF